MDARIPFMLSSTSGSTSDENRQGAAGSDSSAKGWSLARMLGVEDCCRPMLFPAANVETPPAAPPAKNAGAAAQRPVQEAASKTPEVEKESGGFFSGLAKSVTGALAQRAAAAESQKRNAALENHLKLLKGGGLMFRHLAGEASKQVEWRSPQLILNRPVGKQSVALDEVRSVRGLTEADNALLPKGGAGCKIESCFIIVTDKIKVVFEATTKEECASWITALQEASALLVPTLHANLHKKIQEEKRQKELEERRQSRETRRAEYAAGGMNHTARIMAGIKP